MSRQNNADNSLLARLIQDDYNAFREIYDKYWSSLFNAAFKRLRNLHDAEEIVQDVFINFYERRADLNISHSLEAYLHTAVRYRVFNKFREWIRQKEAFKIVNLENLDCQLPPDYLAEEKQAVELIDSAINKLPPKCKEVFLLSRNDQLTHKQVAEKLNISINTVEKHIGKALSILRQELSNYRFGPYAVILMHLCLSIPMS